MITYLVSEKPEAWEGLHGAVQVMSPEHYLSTESEARPRSIQVINLCSSYQYQSMGYYISLLAEARGHRVLPVTSTLMDFTLPVVVKGDADDFDAVIQHALADQTGELCELVVYLGRTREQRMSKLGRLLFNLYPSPLLRAVFFRKKTWKLQSLKPLNPKELQEEGREFMRGALDQYLSGKRGRSKAYTRKKFDLAILVNPDEATPPSDAKAIQRFLKAADKVGFNTELITRQDFPQVTRFDALFIRETTRVNHHTYRMARRAEYEGLVVIDDPTSILRCTNKVYLQELLTAHKLPVPPTVVMQKGLPSTQKAHFSYPYVLKLPDGSFSQGVKKVADEGELKECLRDFYKTTDLVIAQAFMPTEFDWRVGVLGGKPLYLCRYFMAPEHWQIVEWQQNQPTRSGGWETLPLDQAPKGLLEVAVKATNLIGKGLYGVDIKEVKGQYYIIEVNDNPSIDGDVEDAVAKQSLYETIMQHMLQQVLKK